MHAFDYLVLLFSFVYALAFAHVLAMVGDLVTAGRRVRVSWAHAGWALIGVSTSLSWWLSFWELRGRRVWPIAEVWLWFSSIAVLYLQTRLICPRVPDHGPVDLVAFHHQSGRKYQLAFALSCVMALAFNSWYGTQAGISQYLQQNYAVLFMLAAALAAAAWRNARVQVVSVIAELAAWSWYWSQLQAPLHD